MSLGCVCSETEMTGKRVGRGVGSLGGGDRLRDKALAIIHKVLGSINNTGRGKEWWSSGKL